MTSGVVRRVRSVSVCLCVVLAGGSRSAAAQERAFADALHDLTAAVEGTSGNEGARIAPALDRMTTALAEWDREIQALATTASSRASGPDGSLVERQLTLARMYAARGRPLDALRAIDDAARTDPANTDVHLLRGLVLDASSRSEEARKALHTAWTLDRRNPIKAYYVARSGDPGETNRAATALSEAYQNALRGAVQTKTGRFPERIAVISGGQATVLPPARYTRAYSLIQSRDYDAALAEFRTASALDPLVNDPAVRSPALTGAVAALLDGRVLEARTQLEQSPLLAQSSEMHRVLGLTYWIQSEFDKSVEQLETAIRLRSDDERSRIALSRVLTSAGRDADANRALQDTLTALPESSLAHWWLGLAYQRDNRFDEARRELERAASGAVAGEGTLYAAVGRLAMQAGDFAGANDAFARSIAAAPNDGDVHEQFARALVLQDRTDAALVEFTAAALISPKAAGAHAGIGQIELDAGHDRAAAAALRQAVALAPGLTEARYALATALRRLGELEESDMHFARVEREQRQALAERRRTIALDVLREEAALRAADGSYERAAALWQQVVDREPDQPAAHMALAGMLAASGQLDAAIQHYGTAAALGAGPDVYLRLADLHAKAGHAADAARARAMYQRSQQREQDAQGAR